jgi:hypothetical protein
MWAIAFCIWIGSYAFLPASLIGHAAIIAAVAITGATWATAAKRPDLFPTGLGRQKDGEHR